MTAFAASNHDAPGMNAAAPLTPRASRGEAAQALVLAVGTLGILFGLAIVVGTPLAGIG
jgi:hypothetical protein